LGGGLPRRKTWENTGQEQPNQGTNFRKLLWPYSIITKHFIMADMNLIWHWKVDTPPSIPTHMYIYVEIRIFSDYLDAQLW
jgi:hypothetical protein